MEEKLNTLFGDQFVKNVIDEIAEELSGDCLERRKRLIERHVWKLFNNRQRDIIETVKSEIKSEYINSLTPKHDDNLYDDNITWKREIRRYIEQNVFEWLSRTREKNDEIILEYLTNKIYTDLECAYKNTSDIRSKFTFNEFVDIKFKEDYRKIIGPMLSCIRNDMQFHKHTSTHFQPLMNMLFKL
jgi:hypothetical protein